MECLGPQCASMLLEWLKARSEENSEGLADAGGGIDSSKRRQGTLFTASAYQEDASAVRTPAEFAGAVEHLEYAVFRRYQNQLTRAERARLDNSIDNALFKAERYVARLDSGDRATLEDDLEAIRRQIRDGRERV